jgi:Sporulation and spore germination
VGSRRFRRLRPIVALAALLGLAACSAGVPRTGEVVSFSGVTSPTGPENEAETLQDAGGPVAGQSEIEVAVGFMNAMNSGDVTKMQRWVMPEARDQVVGWVDPTTTVRVYSVFEPGLEHVSGDRRIVPIKVKLVGQLRDGREWYPATGDDLLSLELGNDGPDARVANPGSVIWMRDVNFSRLYTQAEVFMVPDLADPSPRLAPVPVFVPRGAEGNPEAPRIRVERALELLLAGPRGRYDQLDTAIPRGTEVREFRYAEDVATINLSRRFTRGTASGRLRVGQLVWTVNRLLPSASVRILVEGRPVRSLGGDQFRADRPWRRRDGRLAGLWPRRSQERHNGSILFVRRGEILQVPPQPGQSPRPIDLDAPSPKWAPTWSPNHHWVAFLAGTGTSQALWLARPDGDTVGRVGLPGRLSPPTWSPDSQRIYLVSRDEAGSRLLEVPLDTLSDNALEVPPLPSGLQLSSIAVSPDGAFVLGVADRPGRRIEDAEPVPGGQLFLGQFGPEGVIKWSGRPLAPGLGRVFSPVWVDPVTVGFIAETENKDDLGRLWTVKSDGWDPNAVLNDADIPMGDIGNQLTVDPAGRAFVVTARSSTGANLWLVNRQERLATPLTIPGSYTFDSDPGYASR